MSRLLIVVAALFGLLGVQTVLGQTAPDKYWVQFKDKIGTPFTISQPNAYLSQKSMERRALAGIGIEESDLPVNPAYIQEVLALGDIQLLHRSKWFNSISIYTPDSLVIEQIAALPSVKQVKSVESMRGNRKPESTAQSTIKSGGTGTYGESFVQTSMVNGQMLHKLGFAGRGMDIAVLDAGFTNVDLLSVFAKPRAENRITPVWDFVDNDASVYHGSAHGTYVLSIMCGHMPDSLIGSGFEANYYLFRTEEAATEYVVEEDNWVAAAERADSMGVWLINSSLGYSLYDDSTMNHTYADMNGSTTRISRGADMAARKGILVCTSAGNSALSPWHFITAPADADSVLTIGAVDGDRLHASFSSFGPTSDGRVKPNVCGQGRQTSYANMDGGVSQGNGTSFSSPLICGFAASLWQLHPTRSNMEILGAIEQSAHLYQNPNDSLGYGIPDFWQAHRFLQQSSVVESPLELSIFPNPFSDDLRLVFRPGKFGKIRLEIFDVFGRPVRQYDTLDHSGEFVIHQLGPDLRGLNAGAYILHCTVDGIPFFVKKVVKY